MPIHARENLYNGINAHLHSLLQARSGDWETFHAAHIIDLGRAIDEILPPGYVIAPEKSMQIREFHPDSGDPVIPSRRQSKRPDLSITAPESAPPTRAASISTPTLTLPASEALDEDVSLYLRGLAVRELSGGALGRVVTWIELLSPTNKPPRRGYREYRAKRNLALENGIALVEIDYLHETRPAVPNLGSYPGDDANAFPYAIVVTNPRPSLNQGEMRIYGISVDERMPAIPIPLSGTDNVSLDMQTVYDATFRSFGYYGSMVDYAQLPVNIERYRDTDQAKIRARMAQIAARQPGGE